MEVKSLLLEDPAERVVQKLAESRISRQQLKTKEELDAITIRIKSTLEDFDDSNEPTSFKAELAAGVEFVDDIKQFEALLKDNIFKNAYQQKVTVIVVGYKNLCSQRFDILAQLSEFFNQNAVYDDGEDSVFALEKNIDVEALNSSIQSSMQAMETALTHLDDIGRDVMSYMGHLHHLTTGKTAKNKKKMEKALHNAKDEIAKMTEKMQQFQQDISMKDERIHKINMHLDAKKLELSGLKKELETTKKTYSSMHAKVLGEKNTLLSEVERLQNELNQPIKEEHDSIRPRAIEAKLLEIRDTALSELNRMKIRNETETLDVDEVKQELAEHFRVQMQQMRICHMEEVESWREECRTHIHNILELEISEEESQKWLQTDVVEQSSSYKDKAASPYQTSSVYSDVKPSSPGNSEDPQEDNGIEVDEERKLSDDQSESKQQSQEEEINHLHERIRSMEVMQNNMTQEALKWQEERTQLLARIDAHKSLQEAAEAETEELMKSMEELVAVQEQQEKEINTAGDGDVEDDVTQPLTEDNVQEINKASKLVRAGSPSTFSKPTSPLTNQSLASAYRQKIAERREAISKRKEDSESRTGIDTPQLKGMFDTGLLEEFLRSYRAVVHFKDQITQEMSRFSAHEAKAHTISAVPTSSFETTNDQVQLHVSNMSTSVEQVLSTIRMSVASMLSESSSTSNAEHLVQQITDLQDEIAKHRSEQEKRSQHDAAMIMHLQNTLSETQRGNTTVAGTSGSGFPSSPAGHMFGKSPSSSQRPFTNESDLTIVFTRQDTEHNKKALKKSAAAGKITQGTLESVVTTMEAYNAIPVRRIQFLANKLVHHTKMKVIETNVRNSNLVTAEVFAVLERMETLQQRRAQNWSREMDEMTSERRRLAAVLCDAFQRLEGITGAFLIKPVVSYRGKGHFRKYSGKISTKYNKHQIEAMLQKMLIKKSMIYGAGGDSPVHQGESRSQSKISAQSDNRLSGGSAMKPSASGDHPLNVAGLRGNDGNNVWNVQASRTLSEPALKLYRDDINRPFRQHPTTVPRLLELDIGRHHVEMTNVHSLIPPEMMGGIGSDRLKNMEILNLRSHSNISRTGSDIHVQPKRADQHSNNDTPEGKSGAPPTTPASLAQIIRRGSSGMQLHTSNDILISEITSSNSPKPLPPIRISSNRSSISSVTSHKPFTPQSAVSTSRSMPDLSRMEMDESPLHSARKDIATSPVGNN